MAGSGGALAPDLGLKLASDWLIEVNWLRQALISCVGSSRLIDLPVKSGHVGWKRKVRTTCKQTGRLQNISTCLNDPGGHWMSGLS